VSGDVRSRHSNTSNILKKTEPISDKILLFK